MRKSHLHIVGWHCLLRSIPQSVPGIKQETPSHRPDVLVYGISKALTIEKYLNLFPIGSGDWITWWHACPTPYGELQNPFAKQGAVGVFLGKVVQVVS